MIVIGLTGSIGMGKTTAATMLAEMGIPVHDSDAAVHKLLGVNGAAVGLVGMHFPAAVEKTPSGEKFIDRQKLGKIVFGDREAKKKLEDILHPMVRAESDAFKDKMKKEGQALVVLDIPLLFETGGEKRVDVTICVTAAAETQRARVMARPGMTSEKFEKIVSGQLPDAEKKRRSNYVVETDLGLDDTRNKLKRIIDEIRARSEEEAG